MTDSNTETFLGGALILTVANVLSRLLGALYRIPLYPVLGKEGIGLFSMAYPIYSLILIISTAGINVAVSKLVAEREALSDHSGAGRVFRTSLWLLGISGFVLSVALYALSPMLAKNVTKDPRAALSIAAIAPAVFFVSLMSAYRGLFQGLQRMTPTAISLVVEQIVRVATMFVLAFQFLPMGVEFAAAGATFGAVTGAVAGLTFLVWVFSRSEKTKALLSRMERASTETVGDVVRKIIRIAVPISLTSGILGLIQIVDVVVVPGRLQSLGLEYSEATAMFGQLSGGAVPIMNMPTVFTSALQVSLVPAITRALAVGDWDGIRTRTATAIRLTFLLMVPASVGIFVLSKEIPSLLYGDPGVGPALAALSGAVLFLSLQQTSSGALQGLGHFDVPVKTLLLGALVKVMATYLLTGIPHLNVRGAAYATVAAFLIASSLNLTALSGRIGALRGVGGMVLKPVVASAVMGVVARLAFDFFNTLTARASVATILAIGMSAATYAIVLLLIGGVREDDLKAVPRIGPWLARLLRRTGLLRG